MGLNSLNIKLHFFNRIPYVVLQIYINLNFSNVNSSFLCTWISLCTGKCSVFWELKHILLWPRVLLRIQYAQGIVQIGKSSTRAFVGYYWSSTQKMELSECVRQSKHKRESLDSIPDSRSPVTVSADNLLFRRCVYEGLRLMH